MESVLGKKGELGTALSLGGSKTLKLKLRSASLHAHYMAGKVGNEVEKDRQTWLVLEP